MNNSRLSLADFKAKAEITNTDALLEKVQGGESSGCHGFWGQVGKAWDEYWENPVPPHQEPSGDPLPNL